jgi:hypothetical protein
MVGCGETSRHVVHPAAVTKQLFSLLVYPTRSWKVAEQADAGSQRIRLCRLRFSPPLVADHDKWVVLRHTEPDARLPSGRSSPEREGEVRREGACCVLKCIDRGLADEVDPCFVVYVASSARSRQHVAGCSLTEFMLRKTTTWLRSRRRNLSSSA